MKKLQVLGPFNSGTNLLLDMFQNNCIDVNDCKVIDISSNILSWKHTLCIQFIRQKLKASPDHVIIVMYKNLYNWIYSVHRNPYDIRIDNGIYGKVALLNIECENIVNLYNRYLTTYQHILKEFQNRLYV